MSSQPRNIQWELMKDAYERRDLDLRRRRRLRLIRIAILWLAALLVFAICGFAQADELVREGRYTLVDDQGETISVHNELHVAIVNGQAWSREHDGRTFKIHPPAYRGSSDPVGDQPAPLPDPVDPPDNPDLPDRIERGAIKNQSAADFEIERPELAIEFDDNGVPTKWAATAGAWLDFYPRTFQLPYELRNGVIHDYGPYPGKSGWDHAIYANNAHLVLHDVWLYGPTHLEPRGRSHPIYLNGSSLTASRLLIGHPDDEFPHTISINIAGGDGVSNGPQPVDIDTLVVIGGRRVVIEADADTLSRLHIGRLIVIDPVTADGLWEGIEIAGCPDIQIGEYVVIDRAGRWTSGALIKAEDCQGEVGRAVIYGPNAPPAGLIRGVSGEVVRLDAPPAGGMPDVGVENIDALADWATGDAP